MHRDGSDWGDEERTHTETCREAGIRWIRLSDGGDETSWKLPVLSRVEQGGGLFQTDKQGERV